MRVTAILILATFFICAAQTKSGNKKQGIIRKKFFFSIGVGPALVYNYTRIYDPTGSIDKNFNQGAISTDFRLGYALSPNWIIYYDNKACFLNAYTLANTTTGKRKLLFSEGVTGLAITRFMKRSSPSFYLNGSIGIASRVALEASPAYPEKGNGFGASFGAGHQFSNRLSIEANIIFGISKDTPQDYFPWQANFLNLQIIANYLWFRSYRGKKKR